MDKHLAMYKMETAGSSVWKNGRTELKFKYCLLIQKQMMNGSFKQAAIFSLAEELETVF